MAMKLYTLNFSYVQVPHERLRRRVCEREYALACFMCPLSDRKNKMSKELRTLGVFLTPQSPSGNFMLIKSKKELLAMTTSCVELCVMS